jgi:hypothetical protein
MKPWKCSRCGKKYANPDSVRAHIYHKHRDIGEPQRVPPDDDEPSFADRARQAEIDRAMGIPNDDDWLLP